MNLSVNLNKVALLRNSRGASNPSPLRAAEVCVEAGAAGLTLHWREDERHTRRDDVVLMRSYAAKAGVEFNLEGDDREELLELALEVAPDQTTLVPVTPGEITSDHGWDLPKSSERLRPSVERLRRRGIRVSIFMDARPELMKHAAALGVDRVELYTEPFARAVASGSHEEELSMLVAAAREAASLGMGVNAGHDLDLRNLPLLAAATQDIDEVSIGHALLADALYVGLHEAVSRYRSACRGEQPDAPKTS